MLGADPVRHDPVALGPDLLGWERHQAGPAFLAHVRDGHSPRAVATFAPAATRSRCSPSPPGPRWPRSHGAARRPRPPRPRPARGGAGPRRPRGARPAGGRPRPRGPLPLLPGGVDGSARVVAGTRAAVFAPLPNLGLVAVLEDGDDSHAEQRARRTRTSARSRPARRAGRRPPRPVRRWTRTAETQLLLESGWARPVLAGRDTVRATAPRMAIAGRPAPTRRTRWPPPPACPATAGASCATPCAVGPSWSRCRARGTCRRSCQTCREPARAPRATARWPSRTRGSAPRAAGAAGPPPTGRAGTAATAGSAPSSPGPPHRRGARPRVPRVDVRTSGGSHVLDVVPGGPSLVIATPGPNPLRRRGTPRPCCSTAGRCWRGRTCVRPRRRTAAGRRPRPWCSRVGAGERRPRRRPAGRPAQALVRGTRPGSPSASWPSAASSTSPRPRGSPASSARRGRRGVRRRPAGPARGAGARAAARCRTAPGRRPPVRSVVRVPREHSGRAGDRREDRHGRPQRPQAAARTGAGRPAADRLRARGSEAGWRLAAWSSDTSAVPA